MISPEANGEGPKAAAPMFAASASAKSWTQDKLAERSDLATRNLQTLEAGEINILLTTAFRIQLGLRCPWHRLMPKE